MDGRRTVSLESIETRMRSYADRADEALSQELALYKHSRFHDPLVYAVEGGKRVRPVLLMLSAEALGCKDDSVLGASVAVELLHTESIIHDDIIDEETARRAKMTFHLKYGYSASLLTADFVFAMILAIAARYRDRRVAEEISGASLRMAEGEYSELTIDPQVYNLTWDEYLKIIADKTAALFETSAKLGALVAGGSEKDVAALAEYGRSLGIAYQLRDDLLDWRSQDKIALGLLKNHSESEVVGKMTALSQTYAEEAKRQLMQLPISNASRFLEDLTDFTVQREH
jgi:octaprenyl-diphosphate synthase